MTFQYVMVDSEAHKVTFANAGGCNPFLIKKDKITLYLLLKIFKDVDIKKLK